jgi:hypothetical protein
LALSAASTEKKRGRGEERWQKEGRERSSTEGRESERERNYKNIGVNSQYS